MAGGNEPSAGEFRHRVWFERREALDPNGPGDGAGGFLGDWKPLFGWRSVCLRPTKGGQEIIAARLQGVALHDLWVWSDSDTRRLRSGDRAVDKSDDTRIFRLTLVGDMRGRRAKLLFQAEEGVAT